MAPPLHTPLDNYIPIIIPTAEQPSASSCMPECLYFQDLTIAVSRAGCREADGQQMGVRANARTHLQLHELLQRFIPEQQDQARGQRPTQEGALRVGVTHWHRETPPAAI